MANDFFSTLRVYLSKISEGDKAPAEVLASLNNWLRDSGESIKIKIEEEVQKSVKKMGFVKQTDFERLKKEVEALKSLTSSKAEKQEKETIKKSGKSAPKPTSPKSATSKSAIKSVTPKKATAVKKKAVAKAKK